MLRCINSILIWALEDMFYGYNSYWLRILEWQTTFHIKTKPVMLLTHLFLYTQTPSLSFDDGGIPWQSILSHCNTLSVDLESSI